ncbi:hypothetical protein K9M50_02175 [Patescibacteria group bacterium]|nr:hypothetical protein [Patescibacteria group bacterium]
MKKLLFLMPFVVFVILLTSCEKQQIPMQPYVVQDAEVKIDGNYIGSDYKGNYVWGGAMNLAWNELNENVLEENLKLQTDDETALNMVEKFNNPIFTKDDLNKESYYIKSGYGQSIVDEINYESRKKFPTKSFADLNIKLGPTDIISYAYFLKEVKYKTVFEKKDLYFKDQKVKGFYAQENDQKKNIKIIDYSSDDKFIISLKLKNDEDQLILAKGYDMESPLTVVNKLKQSDMENLTTLDDSDNFEAPNLYLDHHRDYVELTNRYLANKGFEEYFIAQMMENIKFTMNEKGAKAENEAVIMMTQSMKIDSEKPKNFILDKPYWVIMKRKNSKNPYFILGVNNVELMKKTN